MLTTFYRKYIPAKIRDRIYKLFLGYLLVHLRSANKNLLSLFYLVKYSIVTPRNEREKNLYILGKVGISSYPYLWIKEYSKMHFDVHIDDTNHLPYILHHNHRLYFKQDMIKEAEESYKCLLIEQDKRSAHRYVEDYKELQNKNLLDIGAAEAIFTLNVIEYIDHAYLFECDENWIKALEATFAPWKEKITIIRKYVSNIDNNENITIDHFLENKPLRNIFLKMDIEGFERKALEGCKKTLLMTNNVSGSVCIYHKKDDPQFIESLLKKNGYHTYIQPGVLYFEKEFRPAIVRFKWEKH